MTNAEWIHNATLKTVSPLGETVADLLNEAYDGLHHLPRSGLLKADWSNPQWIRIAVPDGRYATYDTNLLTRLVVLAHDYCVRLEIMAAAHLYLWLEFSPRQREDNLYHRHPTIEDAIMHVRGQRWWPELAV